MFNSNIINKSRIWMQQQFLGRQTDSCTLLHQNKFIHNLFLHICNLYFTSKRKQTTNTYKILLRIAGQKQQLLLLQQQLLLQLLLLLKFLLIQVLLKQLLLLRRGMTVDVDQRRTLHICDCVAQRTKQKAIRKLVFEFKYNNTSQLVYLPECSDESFIKLQFTN